MICPSCKTAMKPLFTGFFCPKECDRPAAKKRVNPMLDGGRFGCQVMTYWGEFPGTRPGYEDKTYRIYTVEKITPEMARGGGTGWWTDPGRNILKDLRTGSITVPGWRAFGGEEVVPGNEVLVYAEEVTT